jgi:TonB family protein
MNSTEWLIKATVLLLAAYALNLALRHSSASSRHLVWAAALAGLLVLPVLSMIVPAWQAPLPASPETGLLSGAAGITIEPAAPHPPDSRRPSALFLLWALGASVLVGRLLVGRGRVWWLARGANQVPMSDLAAMCRRAAVLQTDRAPAPMTFGLLRPIILLPKGATQWSRERLRVVLTHEMIHVRRQDYLTQILAQLACAIYWFHPLVWLAAAKLRQERERACDDGVLNLGFHGPDYAQHLLDLARSLQPGSESWSPAVAMAQPSSLETRLVALLDPTLNHRAVTKKGALLTALISTGLMLPIAAVRAPGQIAGGRLAGSVHDASGAAVPRAGVTLSAIHSDRKEITYSNDAGEYQFQSLPEGGYALEARKPGFAVFQRKNVVVQSNAPRRLDIVLEIGRVAEIIDVVGEAPRNAITSPSAGPPRRIRVGGNVQATKLVFMSKPGYPERARNAGIEGTVLLIAVISKDGGLIGLKPLNSLVDPELTQAAMEAVKQWRYQPTLLNSEPVEVVTTITVNFRLTP